MFLWSSVGSVAVGLAVALAGKPRKRPAPKLACRKIPGDCATVWLWTERFELEDGSTRRLVHDRYVLEATPFKVWSVLDVSPEPGKPNPKGLPIYHATHHRIVESPGNGTTKEQVQERFYGTVRAVNPVSGSCANNHLARGGLLEIDKCYVGGASNGIETGEVHRSAAPILNFRFEYEPPPLLSGATGEVQNHPDVS